MWLSGGATTAGVLYGRHDFVASRLDQPQNRLIFQLLFVALYVGPRARRVAMWLFGAAPDDVERPVVVLDVRVTEPHVFVGYAVSKCHGNCHGSNLQMRQQNAGRDRG
jgi:hypothetical protein